MTEPCGKLALVSRLCFERSDAQAGSGDAEFVGIQARQRFSKRLGHSVVATRPYATVLCDAVFQSMKSDGLDRTREDDAPCAGVTGGLKDLIRPQDIRFDQRLERTFFRYRSEVDDLIDAAHSAFERCPVGKMG